MTETTDYSKFTMPKDASFALNIKPRYTITFNRNDKPEPVGVLDFNGPEMTFTGDADESAKIFMEFIAERFAGRLKEERENSTPPREWVGLTRDETMGLVNATAGQSWCDEAHLQRFSRAIEAKLKELNT